VKRKIEKEEMMEIKEEVIEKKRRKRKTIMRRSTKKTIISTKVQNNFIKRQKDLNVCNNVIYKILCNVCDALYVVRRRDN